MNIGSLFFTLAKAKTISRTILRKGGNVICYYNISSFMILYNSDKRNRIYYLIILFLVDVSYFISLRTLILSRRQYSCTNSDTTILINKFMTANVRRITKKLLLNKLKGKAACVWKEIVEGLPELQTS